MLDPADPYSVRRAEADDLLAVVRLIERSPELSDDRLTDRQHAAWSRMMATQDLTVYLAEAHGSAVVPRACS